MFCANCGKEIDDHAVICVHCGVPVKGYSSTYSSTNDGPIGCLLGGLCFLFPILGLILYLVWIGTQPVKAKDAGKWALIGFVINIVLIVLFGIG